VVNLMDALRRSVQTEKGDKPEKAASTHHRARKAPRTSAKHKKAS
jgi:non-homologous end joining protein Ku